MEIKLGQKWAHYKHPEREYEIIGIARNSNNWEEEMVVYKALYAAEMPYGQLCVRPKKEFFDIIEKDKKKVQRFTLISDAP